MKLHQSHAALQARCSAQLHARLAQSRPTTWQTRYSQHILPDIVLTGLEGVSQSLVLLKCPHLEDRQLLLRHEPLALSRHVAPIELLPGRIHGAGRTPPKRLSQQHHDVVAHHQTHHNLHLLAESGPVASAAVLGS